MLAKNLFERSDRVCKPHARTASKDVMIADCFRANNVHPYDTRDEFGSERFMHLTPAWHFTYMFDSNPRICSTVTNRQPDKIIVAQLF